MTRYFYAEPIRNRTQADVDARAYKAFFNLRDWSRIYHNAVYVNRIYFLLFNLEIPFTEIAEPTMADMPDVENFNALLANINRVCEVASIPLVPQKADWTTGKHAETFNFENVNAWEFMLAEMLDYARGTATWQVYCGVANTGQARFFQSRFRGFDWVESSGATATFPRMNVSTCGRTYSNQNRFRRY